MDTTGDLGLLWTVSMALVPDEEGENERTPLIGWVVLGMFAGERMIAKSNKTQGERDVPASALFATYLTELKTYIHTKNCTRIFTASLIWNAKLGSNQEGLR